MSTGTNEYYAGNPLNRLSYLRQSPAFLSSCLTSPKAKFLLYSKLDPLFQKSDKKEEWKLKFVGWKDVEGHLMGGKDFWRLAEGKDEKALGEVDEQWKTEKGLKELSQKDKIEYFTSRPNMVFLGVDERSAPASSKSLPLSKPTEESSLESHSPYGEPYWALDVEQLPALRNMEEGNYRDLRTGMSFVDKEDAAIAGEGRALLDWNTRNVYCQGCSRPMRPLWGGWKRICVGSTGFDSNPTCPSKGRGVQNYNYPRTDPVVIMAITSPDRESILLGRQKVWPKGFYSALAGFLEFGESIEEAVRREVYEEAGIEVGDVYYHSSQPWPYPASLMIGAIGVAKPNQTIRLDLDNELEHARYFTRSEVLKVLEKGTKPLTEKQAKRFDPASEEREKKHSDTEEEGVAFKMPPKTAIAHSLVEAWARNTWLGSGKL